MKIKSIFQISGALALVAVLNTFSCHANADSSSVTSSSDTTIGVVNVELIIQESKAFQAVMTQVEKINNEHKQELQKKEKELNSQMSKLEGERKALSESIYNEKHKKIIEQAQAVQANSSQLKKVLYASYQDAIASIQSKVNDITSTVAGKQFSYVFDRNAVIIFPNSTDITSKVAQKLNEDMPTYKLDLNKGKQLLAEAEKQASGSSTSTTTTTTKK